MTMLREPRYETMPVQTRRSSEWITGVVGALATAIGAWMYHAPEAGMLTFFGWEWDVAGMARDWPLAILVVGGLTMFAGFGAMSRRMFLRDAEVTGQIAAASALALVGAIATIAYLLVWIF